MHRNALPDWAHWKAPGEPPWSLSVSEDVMVVEPERGVLARLDSAALRKLSPLLAAHASSEAGAGVVALTTTRHCTVAAAGAELALMRSELAETLDERLDLVAAAAGLHPWSECALPPAIGPLRPRPPTQLAGILGRLDPTCSLRVEVVVPDAEAAVRAFDGLRSELPLLLALSANSPLWRGRYSGLASTRTALRATLGEPGLPREFGSYASYVATVDSLIRGGVSELGWDMCLRPERGAIELTIMDAQSRVADVIGLAALTQCLVKLFADRQPTESQMIPELILSNRASAARAGMRALLAEHDAGDRIRAMERLWTVIDECAPVARELGCSRELAYAARTAADAGHVRQRRAAGDRGLLDVVAELTEAFAERPDRRGLTPAPSGLMMASWPRS